MLVRVLCCVVAWMPLRIWEATGLPICVIIIIIECGKRKPSPASSLSSQQPLAGSPRDPSSSRSTAVNATYSEVTARTRVCLHIDITAGRDSGDREGGVGSGEGESRDLIPSKLSPRICPHSVRRDMVMPPLRCSAVSRSTGGLAALGGQIKSRGKEGDRHAHALSRSSLCHRSDTAPLPKLQ